MSGGGRIGLDAPYVSKECQHRWYDQSSICYVFERFHNVLFLGDESLQQVYNGVSMLLSSNVASGTVKTWKMNDQEKNECRCENQFQHEKCHEFFITSSDDYKDINHDKLSNSPCPGHHSHSFHPVAPSTTSSDLHRILDNAMSNFPKSPSYKPLSIIFSVSPYTASQKQTADLLHLILATIKSQPEFQKRKTPVLWIGPTAPGHIDLRGRKTNQEIWEFDKAMENSVRQAGVERQKSRQVVEVLKMWNMTVQAASWDGVRFGSKVALTQGMMVVNWLSRLESS